MRSVLFSLWCLFACIVGGAAGATRGVSPAEAQASAESLLAHLQASPREDLATCAALDEAFIAEGVIVHGYAELESRYHLCPILSRAGEYVGVVAVHAHSGKWCWYTLGAPRESLFGTDRKTAVVAARNHAMGRGLTLTVAEPIAVVLPDKHVYWLVRGANDVRDERVLVSVDDRHAPPLSTVDGSLADHLERQPRISQHQPPADWQPSGRDAVRLPRPDVYNISGLPFDYQIMSWYCGCAAVAMMLDYYGAEIGQHDIGDVANESPYYGTYAIDNRRACHFSAMSTALQNPDLHGYNERSLGYAGNDTWLYDDPYNHLKDQIASNTPMEILTCYDGYCDTGHYRVVKGYDDGLNEFIVHDPWYGAPFFGPELHFDQQFLVEDMWRPWYNCWGMTTGPWTVNLTLPEQVDPSEAFQVIADVHYPGAGPFGGQHRASPSTARISLPEGFALAGGSAVVTLPDLYSGDRGQAVWDVIAGESSGEATIAVRAMGIITATSSSYPSYTDSIGGHGCAEILVGAGRIGDWGPDERLTDNLAGSSTAWSNGRSVYAEPHGVVHVVWADSRDGNSEIYYRRWGDAWGAETRLTDDPGFSDNPVIAGGPGGALHVAWVDTRDGNQEIYYKKWDGSSWSSDTRLTDYGTGDVYPAIAADGLGNVHVVWHRLYSFWARVVHLQWDGVSWSEPLLLGGVPNYAARMPSIAACPDGTTYVAYEQDAASREPGDIYVRIFDGSSWTDPVALTSDPSYSRCPSVTVDPNGHAHIVWHDGRDLSGAIYYSSYEGNTWSSPEGIVTDLHDQQCATIACDPYGWLHVAWQDARDGNAEIYYKSRMGSWSADERLTAAAHASVQPSIATDAGGQACLVWTDCRDGNDEVYCKQRFIDPAALPDASPGLSSFPGIVWSVWPTPVSARATVEFTLQRAAPVRLEIFDTGGRHVRTLIEGNLPAGQHRATWDRQDAAGRCVDSGIFYLRLRAAGQSANRPLVIFGD